MKQVIILHALIYCFSCQSFAQDEIKFEKAKFILGRKNLQLEVADSNEKREHGLMNRRHLGENEGMIFIFDEEQTLSFWMKNTLIPLDIGYFDQSKTLIDIQNMQPASPMEVRPKSYPSKKPAKYAIEMSENWFRKNRIKIGAKFKTSP